MTQTLAQKLLEIDQTVIDSLEHRAKREKRPLTESEVWEIQRRGDHSDRISFTLSVTPWIWSR